MDEKPFEQHNRYKYSGAYRPPIWVWLLKVLKNRWFLGTVVLLAFAFGTYFVFKAIDDIRLPSFKKTKPVAEVDKKDDLGGIEEIIATIAPKAPPQIQLEEIRKIIKEEIKSSGQKSSQKDKVLLKEIDRLKAIVASQKEKIRKLELKPPAPQKNKYQYLIDKYFQNPVGTLCVKYVYQGKRHGERVMRCWDDGYISNRKY